MAFTPISGINGSVKIATTVYAFDKWTITFETKAVEVSNFTGSGYRQFVAGLTGATLTIEGPHDGGNMAFTAGTQYTFILGENATYTYSLPAIVTKIEPKNDVDDAARVTITAQATGVLTAAIQ